MGAVGARAAARLIVGHDPFRVAGASASLCSFGLVVAGVGGRSLWTTALAMAMVLTGFSAGQVALVATVPLAVAAEDRSVAIGLYTLPSWSGGPSGRRRLRGCPIRWWETCRSAPEPQAELADSLSQAFLVVLEYFLTVAEEASFTKRRRGGGWAESLRPAGVTRG